MGVNADIITPDCGLLASSVEDWMGAIRMLAGDPEQRAAMGRAGRLRVEQHYARNVIATKLITLFKEVMA